jgi:hypothetical protein
VTFAREDSVARNLSDGTHLARLVLCPPPIR